MDKSIMPECYADTLLIETLVPPKTGYNHKGNCFKVESAMKWTDKFAVGIIDDDKRKIKYLEEFGAPIDKVDGFLILRKHKTKHQYLIQICPALERWVLNICKLEGIDLTTFGLVQDLNNLRGITKNISSLSNGKLKNLFGEIAKRDNNESVRKLKYWVKNLRDKNYNVDINELTNG